MKPNKEAMKNCLEQLAELLLNDKVAIIGMAMKEDKETNKIIPIKNIKFMHGLSNAELIGQMEILKNAIIMQDNFKGAIEKYKQDRGV